MKTSHTGINHFNHFNHYLSLSKSKCAAKTKSKGNDISFAVYNFKKKTERTTHTGIVLNKTSHNSSLE